MDLNCRKSNLEFLLKETYLNEEKSYLYFNVENILELQKNQIWNLMIENTILIWKKSDLEFKRKENMFCDVKHWIWNLMQRELYLNVGKIRSEILCKGKHI